MKLDWIVNDLDLSQIITLSSLIIEGKMVSEFEIKKIANRQFTVNLVPMNRVIVLTSEIYEAKDNVTNGIRLVKK